MSREAELIKEIDEHIKKAGGLYGLELPDSDLRIIRAALQDKVDRQDDDPENEPSQAEKDLWNLKALRFNFSPSSPVFMPGMAGTLDRAIAHVEAEAKRGGDPPSEK